ncbi:pectinesterase PPME1-like [Prosopis cineraria]|uniref:pectinesterase PPME1-like n=1 Tax=Prosopis cineraria TaxID=364024 RepID=UPI00241070BC|nr:pectinesterase PPME1-like [Prosopis cineraria]
MTVATKISRVSSIQVAVVAVIVAATAVLSDDNVPIPSDKDQLDQWFSQNVQPLSGRKGTLDPDLVAAEASPKVVKVSQDGSGDFKTITDAINSVPVNNAKRVIIKIAGGVYTEKVTIDRTKDFITLLGDPKNMPNLTYGGTAKQYGTVDSATLITNGNYFVAANIIFSNSAPIPDGRREGAQAVAIRVSGDKSAFYNCVLLGFQDTLCDDRGNHLFKDCTIQGTVDFIFGSGKSLYLNTKLVVVGNVGGVIAAQARESDDDTIGYSFVHCDISGSANGTFLGRAWMSHGRVVYAYTSMSDIITPLGWNINNHPSMAQTVYFGEYQNSGDGANTKGRAPFTKFLSDADAKEFLSLGFIQASEWLLPPPQA